MFFQNGNPYLKLVTFIFCSKEVTKPRNRTKEFLFNLIFFLILPFLPLFKLGRKIIKCCKKDSNAKKEQGKQDESEEDGKVKGPDVDIFKGDIMKDASLRAESSQSVKLSGEKAGVSRESKENVTTIKQSRTNSLVIKTSEHGEENNIATGGGSQGTKRKISAQGSRRASKEHVTEPLTNKLTSKGKEEDTGTSHVTEPSADKPTSEGKEQDMGTSHVTEPLADKPTSKGKQQDTETSHETEPSADKPTSKRKEQDTETSQVTKPSADKLTSKGKEQDAGTSHQSNKLTVKKTEPSEPQVRDNYVGVLETERNLLKLLTIKLYFILRSLEMNGNWGR